MNGINKSGAAPPGVRLRTNPRLCPSLFRVIDIDAINKDR
ncbi:hypothetical protein C8D90_101865 [Enterobacillus tribolii]|uniref:Uncharacterized protein n=1 Tax=Enterobacillus tribolii TaxID=1487935 RepID=A0A370R5L9_9GAMM|nr:hypothetical protein C8D90_101865 [Enterobacillus tribolii]